MVSFSALRLLGRGADHLVQPGLAAASSTSRNLPLRDLRKLRRTSRAIQRVTQCQIVSSLNTYHMYYIIISWQLSQLSSRNWSLSRESSCYSISSTRLFSQTYDRGDGRYSKRDVDGDAWPWNAEGKREREYAPTVCQKQVPASTGHWRSHMATFFWKVTAVTADFTFTFQHISPHYKCNLKKKNGPWQHSPLFVMHQNGGAVVPRMIAFDSSRHPTFTKTRSQNSQLHHNPLSVMHPAPANPHWKF